VLESAMFMKKVFNRKSIFRYLYDQLTGNFAGFLIGMSATGLVSQFFETRGLRNLWGLTAKKTVVNKETFARIEWIISILIGFIVFELVTKVLKERLDRNMPRYKRASFRWLITNQWHTRLRTWGVHFNTRRMVFYSAMQHSLQRVLKK
jgi:hypothetical protein